MATSIVARLIRANYNHPNVLTGACAAAACVGRRTTGPDRLTFKRAVEDYLLKYQGGRGLQDAALRLAGAYDQVMAKDRRPEIRLSRHDALFWDPLLGPLPGQIRDISNNSALFYARTDSPGPRRAVSECLDALRDYPVHSLQDLRDIFEAADRNLGRGIDPVIVIYRAGNTAEELTSLFSGKGTLSVAIRPLVSFMDEYAHRMRTEVLERLDPHRRLTLEIRLKSSRLAEWARDHLDDLHRSGQSVSLSGDLMPSLVEAARYPGSVKILALTRQERKDALNSVDHGFQDPLLDKALEDRGLNPSETIVRAHGHEDLSEVIRWHVHNATGSNSGRIRDEIGSWLLRLTEGLPDRRDELVRYWVWFAKRERFRNPAQPLGQFVDEILPEKARQAGLAFPLEMAAPVFSTLNTSFVIGGINSEEAIRDLAAVNGILIDELERRMRPGAMSKTGFLGEHESLLNRLAADNNDVLSRGLTHKDFARVLLEVIAKIGHRDGWVRFKYGESKFEGRANLSRGYQYSPFNDGERSDVEYEIVRSPDRPKDRRGEPLKFSGLLPATIGRYGFYEGEGTPNRLRPGAIAEFFGLQTQKSDS